MTTPTDDEIRDQLYIAGLSNFAATRAAVVDAMLPTVRALIDQARRDGAVQALRNVAPEVRNSAWVYARADRLEAGQ